MKCENCLHYEACKSMVNVIERATMYSIAMRVCNNYADKDLYIKLPCKVGDTVYRNGYSFKVEKIEILKDEKICKCGNHGTDDYMAFGEDDIGKTVFLTREDAEKKLEGLKNERSS